MACPGHCPRDNLCMQLRPLARGKFVRRARLFVASHPEEREEYGLRPHRHLGAYPRVVALTPGSCCQPALRDSDIW
jgi:hypothetical protein